MKTIMNNETVLQEAKKMLNRIELFKHVYDFNSLFLEDANKLSKIVNEYEKDKSRDIEEVISAFNTFSIKYNRYVESLRDVS